MRHIIITLLCSFFYLVSCGQNSGNSVFKKDTLIVITKNPSKGFYNDYILFIPKGGVTGLWLHEINCRIIQLLIFTTNIVHSGAGLVAKEMTIKEVMPFREGITSLPEDQNKNIDYFFVYC
jgi:hypothetical protein